MLNIRRADVNYAPAIARVTVDTWKNAYRGIIADEYLSNLKYQDREKGWREFPFQDSWVYIAENDEEDVIGFAAGGPHREAGSVYQGEVYAIYIDEAYQDQGIGTLLLRSVVRKMLASGLNSVIVWVLSDNPYRRFYERRGGLPLESKLLAMDGFENEITAYGWLDARIIIK
ncbi:MAG: GNAT family N-acetyltransferase [Syntrophomonas sp.]